ncbi:MAG: DUF4396 domain-containing protein [Nitrospirota bacterium]
MTHRIHPILAVLMALLLALGLVTVLKKNLTGAPWARQAENNRVHYHMKNVTRLVGTADDVRASVDRAVFLRDAPSRQKSSEDWISAIRGHITTSAKPPHIVALAAEGRDAKVWAVPGAYWAAYAGVPVVFVGREQLDAEAEQAIKRFKAPVYLLAPASLVADSVLRQIAALGPAKRIAGRNPAAHAVVIAEYRDYSTGFGWGRTHDRRNGYFHYVLATPLETEHSLMALPLAKSNAAPFLFTGLDGGIPAVTDRYLWEQRTDFFTVPSEGPFRHAWIVGNRTSYASQSRIDLALEKSPYPDRGSVALGPMEALFIIYIAFGIAGAIFVVLHTHRLLPEVMPAALIGWAFTALLVPVVGVVLYLSAYRRPMKQQDNMVHWQRPPSVQSAAATAMGFGYGAPLMIIVGYAFVYFGFPLFFGPWASGWQFLFGAGMPLMMAGMYVGALLIAWLFAQLPLKAMMGGAFDSATARAAFVVTALSMAAVSLGMMPMSWHMLMEKVPMMPHEDEIMWFGALWFASTAGFLAAWPLNYVMIRIKLKSGAM